MYRRFRVADECGAVSADWLALGAGLMIMALALIGGLSNSTAGLGGDTNAALQSAEVTQLGVVGYGD